LTAINFSVNFAHQSSDMHPAHDHIPIQPVSVTSGEGCGGCSADTRPQSCHAGLGDPCLAPHLSGRSELLRRAMDSLRHVVDPERGRNLVDLHLVQSLHIDDGEAELTVTFPRGCGSARRLAEEAFQSLRGVLPDTDIYVRHAA
jgi:metal-sulfur cluster biosynthetic enzyme